jgi:hypothetical protein
MATVFVRDFPEALHKRAKIQAVEEDLTLRELIIKAVELYLKRGSKGKKSMG